jgi:ABC-type multidrug transport system fused ATPase/permease subunit
MTKLSTLKHIIWNLHTVKKHRWSIGFLMIIYVGFLSSSPYFYKILIDALETSLDKDIISNELFIGIILWIIAIIGTIIMRYVYGMLLLEKTQDDWFNFLMRSMKMMLRLPINYHISIQHGEKQKIIDRASEAVWDIGDNGLLHIFPQILVSVILIISGLFIDVTMTLISLILLPLAVYSIGYLWNKAYLTQRQANVYWDGLFNRIVDVFTNLKVIRIFAREKHETKIIHGKFDLARQSQYLIRKFWLVFNGIGGFFTTLAQAITISAGIYMILHDHISFGTLFFFIGFTEKIYWPIFFIFQKLQETLLHIAGYEKMQLLYTMSPEKDSWKSDFTGIKKSLTFKDVSFVYPSTTREVLKWVNIEVKKWEKIALIGHTGSGKSTIVQILMRFYDQVLMGV